MKHAGCNDLRLTSLLLEAQLTLTTCIFNNTEAHLFCKFFPFANTSSAPTVSDIRVTMSQCLVRRRRQSRVSGHAAAE